MAQRPPGGGSTSAGRPPGESRGEVLPLGILTVYVRGPDGSPLEQMALVTLLNFTHQMYGQATTQGGRAEFPDIPPGQYTVQIVAPAYETVKETVEVSFGGAMVYISLQPYSPAGTDGKPSALGPPILSPKVQKELNQAVEALRAKRFEEARGYLEEAYRHAPGHPQVNYLFGVYYAQINRGTEAKYFWEKAISAYARYLPALLSLGEAMLREEKPAEAVSYLKRAMEAEPSSWRAHALLADAEFRLRSFDEAGKEAERAIAIGHGQAESVQPLLARILAAQGNSDHAIRVLQAYLQQHPADANAQKALDVLHTPRVVPANASNSAPEPPQDLPALPPFAIAFALPSAWMPPDLDEKVPPVDRAVPCPLDTVLHNASERLAELLQNVDRFTATESLKHELISASGLPFETETRRFSYLVSVSEIRPGFLAVEEYRDGTFSYEKFPDGIATLGLPALVLAFHPAEAANYETTCEGLTQWDGRLAWQVHFRQRPDKPRTLRSYRLGGQTYPISLKGRAWIAADTFQVVRLETDLVAPLPEIRLAGEHTAIEYGPVHFKSRNVDMWLPQSAEVYFDLRGRRIHRRHDFSNYLLFAVDEKEKISAPKVAEPAPSDPSPEGQKPF